MVTQLFIRCPKPSCQPPGFRALCECEGRGFVPFGGVTVEIVEQMAAVLMTVKECPLLHDENGHAYLKVGARSMLGTAAAVTSTLAAFEAAKGVQG